MNEQVKKIYDYVSKMEDKHEGELTCGANFETDSINMSAMSAYGSTRWFIEDLLEKENNYKVITLCGSTRFKNEFMEVQKNSRLKAISLSALDCSVTPATTRCGPKVRKKCLMICTKEKLIWQMKFL